MRFAKTYAGEAQARRKREAKPKEGASASASGEAASSEASPPRPPPGAPPRAPGAPPAAGPARNSSFAGPASSPQGTEVRALRQRLARLQNDNQRLSEQLVDARQSLAYGDAPAEDLRLPSLVPGGVRAQQEGALRSSAALRANRPAIAGVPDRQSRAQGHAHKPRPRPGGGAAAGGAAGWSEWEEPEADPHRRRVPPVASKSRAALAAAESRLAEAVAEWSEGDVAARMEELGDSSPRSNQ